MHHSFIVFLFSGSLADSDVVINGWDDSADIATILKRDLGK